MTLPPLTDWETTSRTLHLASMLAVPIQKVLLEPRNNYLHFAMWITQTGTTSQVLPQGGKISVDYSDATLHYQHPDGNLSAFKLADHTQASLFDALLDVLKDDELAAFYTNPTAENMIDRFQKEGEALFTNMDEFTRDEKLIVNWQTSISYAVVLYTIYTAVARFRARLEGHMTPVVIWGEHFDLSTLWFVDPEMSDHKAHLNFGFAPFSDGFDEPYLYVYAYPYPDDFIPPELPAPARWHTEGWTGVVIDYADIAEQEYPAQFVEDLCLQIFDVLRKLL